MNPNITAGGRLPRLRGDGPLSIAHPPPFGGSPAYAGMDPACGSKLARCSRLPRLRGDGPRPEQYNSMPPRAPPPTRGWTPLHPRHSVGLVGSPAYAGMDPVDRKRRTRRPGLPRLRGDGPVIETVTKLQERAPPPTRGWTRRMTTAMIAGEGSPAYAGMDPLRPCWMRGKCWLPRLRGDGPPISLLGRKVRKAPPPTRGWTQKDASNEHAIMGSPAYAGMDPAQPPCTDRYTRLPRLRGDGPSCSGSFGGGAEAPPPTRGWTRLCADVLQSAHGSPAYAGMDPTKTSISGCRMRLPRLRGEDPYWIERPVQSARLPRLRGDGPLLRMSSKSVATAPPPTRGWTLRLPDQRAGRRGSPAYAGMDPTWPTCRL